MGTASSSPAIFLITKAELPLHISRLPLAALILISYSALLSHSVHMTPLTFQSGVSGPAAPQEAGTDWILDSVSFVPYLSARVAVLSFAGSLEVMPSVSDSELQRGRGLLFRDAGIRLGFRHHLREDHRAPCNLSKSQAFLSPQAGKSSHYELKSRRMRNNWK